MPRIAVAMHNKAHLFDRLTPFFANAEQKELAGYRLHSGEEDHFNNIEELTPYELVLAEICLKVRIEEQSKHKILKHEHHAQKERSLEEMFLALERVGPKKINYPPRPYYTIKARGIRADFYLSLIDSSPQNLIAIALGPQLALFDASMRKTYCINPQFSDQDTYISSVRFLGAGKYLAIGTSTGFIHIRDMQKEAWIRRFRISKERIGVLTPLGQNSSALFAGSCDTKIRKLDLRLAKPIVEIFPTHNDNASHHGEICGLAVDPEQKYLVSGGNDNKVLVWDLRARNNEEKLAMVLEDEHGAAVKAIAWHKGGRYFATGAGTADRNIRIWDIEHKRLVAREDSLSQVSSLLWVDDRLFSTHGFSKNELQSWKVSLRKGTILHEYAESMHTDRIIGATFLPGISAIATLGADEALIFWDISNQKVIQSSPKYLDLSDSQGTSIR